MGKQWKQWQTVSSWAPKSRQMVTAAMKLRHLFFGRKVITNLDSLLKSRLLPTKVHLVKVLVFSCSRVWMWELDYKENWAPKNWCFWTVLLEKTLEGPLDCTEIQPVHPKGNQSWIFIGRTDAEAEIPIFWPPNAKIWLTWKDPDAGNDWRLEEKGTTEDEMVGWHHRLTGHEFEYSPGIGDGKGTLACSPWGLKESDTIERLNWTEDSRIKLVKKRRSVIWHKYVKEFIMTIKELSLCSWFYLHQSV